MQKNIKRIQVTQFNFNYNEIGSVVDNNKIKYSYVKQFLKDQSALEYISNVTDVFIAKGLISDVPEETQDLTKDKYNQVIGDLANQQSETPTMIMYLMSYDGTLETSSIIAYIYDGSGLYTYYVLKPTPESTNDEVPKDFGFYKLFKCHSDQIVFEEPKATLPDFKSRILFGGEANNDIVIDSIETFKTHYGITELKYEDNNGSWLLPMDKQEQELNVNVIPIAGFTFTVPQK